MMRYYVARLIGINDNTRPNCDISTPFYGHFVRALHDSVVWLFTVWLYKRLTTLFNQRRKIFRLEGEGLIPVKKYEKINCLVYFKNYVRLRVEMELSCLSMDVFLAKWAVNNVLVTRMNNSVHILV